jgi:hypothetical protein
VRSTGAAAGVGDDHQGRCRYLADRDANARVLRMRLDGWLNGRFEEVIAQLAAGYARVPNRRLVVIGEPGSGKTVLAILLTLGLLRVCESGGPVPVLLPVSSWDPVRERLDRADGGPAVLQRSCGDPAHAPRPRSAPARPGRACSSVEQGGGPAGWRCPLAFANPGSDPHTAQSARPGRRLAPARWQTRRRAALSSALPPRTRRPRQPEPRRR